MLSPRIAKSRTTRSKLRRVSKQARSAEPRPENYWESTRGPLASLMLVAPLLLIYELGCLHLRGLSTRSFRAGADAWMSDGLIGLGCPGEWVLPVAVLSILIAWQVVNRRGWRLGLSTPFLMALESSVLAVALVGLSRLIDLAGAYLESTPIRLAIQDPETPQKFALILGFLGAGIYEETLFRLILVPALFYGMRLMHTPQILASALAVSISGFLFALAHHAGVPGEHFTWFAFVFRWLAGVTFAWIFIIRGFGIAVGTHTAYDILVGWFGCQF